MPNRGKPENIAVWPCKVCNIFGQDTSAENRKIFQGGRANVKTTGLGHATQRKPGPNSTFKTKTVTSYFVCDAIM